MLGTLLRFRLSKATGNDKPERNLKVCNVMVYLRIGLLEHVCASVSPSGAPGKRGYKGEVLKIDQCPDLPRSVSDAAVT